MIGSLTLEVEPLAAEKKASSRAIGSCSLLVLLSFCVSVCSLCTCGCMLYAVVVCQTGQPIRRLVTKDMTNQIK